MASNSADIQRDYKAPDVSSFKSVTEFDKDTNCVYESFPGAQKGCASAVISLITAHEFMINKDISEKKYNENVIKSVSIHGMLGTSSPCFDFRNLISFTDLPDPTMSTAATLQNSPVALLAIIPDVATSTFATIVYKNTEFFTVLGNSETRTYSVRNGKHNYQYDFATRDALMRYLNEIYFFAQEFMIDNVPITEYSSIEYVVARRPFKSDLEESAIRHLDIVLNSSSYKTASVVQYDQKKPSDMIQNVSVTTLEDYVIQNMPRIGRCDQAFADYDDYDDQLTAEPYAAQMYNSRCFNDEMEDDEYVEYDFPQHEDTIGFRHRAMYDDDEFF